MATTCTTPGRQLLSSKLQENMTPKSGRKTPWKTPNSGKGDRFIPNRSAMDMDIARFNLTNAILEAQAGTKEVKDPSAPESNIPPQSPAKAEYKKQLAESLLREGDGQGQDGQGSKILAFKSKPPAPPEGHENRNKVLYSQAAGPAPSRKAFRYVPSAPEKILDAPELVDDYYLNLLDWSVGNVVAVALGPAVYLWDAATGNIEELPRPQAQDDDGSEHVTSLSWAADGKHLALGLSTNSVQIWDTGRLRQVRSLKGHTARVSSMDWNGSTLSTGGRDSLIINHDVRVREHITSQLRGHEQEVCGLKWAPSGNQLASGGNDNLLHIWDAASFTGARASAGTAAGPSQYLHRLDQHQAAVKALAWCPFQSNLLASGGGTADRTIKFWNTHTGVCLNSIDTHSQVCALQWSKHDREILSSHGYSQNQLCLWKYPSMVKMAELTGHSARVLHMAQSPDGTVVASAAADETLRFWRVFGPTGTDAASGGGPIAGKPLAAGGKSKLGGSKLRSINIR